MSVNYKALLSEFERELAEIEADYARLEKKRTALQATIAGLRELENLGTNKLTQRSALIGTSSGISNVEFFGIGIVPAAIRYLEIVGRPSTNRELVEGLLAGGLETKAKDPHMTIRSVLTREMKHHKTFTWKAGRWSLPKWADHSYSLQLEQKATA